ncbi:MAG TPA: peptidoglycan bridge formation glycyltransferase FemA/FemB family protein [Phycisphaerae bacterium]|nr:peptidoglycan bridge formation glycyltransferase FemA/FemB family protein [Phycisphaerae bacterium]
MKLNVVSHVDGTAWDEQVRALGGTVFHCSAWADYIMAGGQNATPQYITLVSDDDRPVGTALGFATRSTCKVLSWFTARLWFDTMPVLADDAQEALPEFLERIEDHAQRTGNVELTIGSYAAPPTAAELAGAGFELTKYWEFVLDLTQTEDDLWTAMEHKRRKNIRKARRSNVIIREMAREEGLRHLRRLQGDSSQRIVARGGPDIRYNGRHEADPVNILLDSGVGQLIGAEVEGEVVSASLFTCFNGLAYHTLSGHNRKALSVQAPTLLLWEMIMRCRREGVMKFNLGGCSADAQNEDSPEHGVYQYKKAFGGELAECKNVSKVLRPGTRFFVKLLRRMAGYGGMGG